MSPGESVPAAGVLDGCGCGGWWYEAVVRGWWLRELVTGGTGGGCGPDGPPDLGAVVVRVLVRSARPGSARGSASAAGRRARRHGCPAGRSCGRCRHIRRRARQRRTGRPAASATRSAAGAGHRPGILAASSDGRHRNEGEHLADVLLEEVGVVGRAAGAGRVGTGCWRRLRTSVGKVVPHQSPTSARRTWARIPSTGRRCDRAVLHLDRAVRPAAAAARSEATTCAVRPEGRPPSAAGARRSPRPGPASSGAASTAATPGPASPAAGAGGPVGPAATWARP